MREKTFGDSLDSAFPVLSHDFLMVGEILGFFPPTFLH